jgi:CBS domain-containing protein
VETLGTQYSLNTRLGELAMRHPVVCSPDTPLREAVRLMHEQQVGSIVVVDPQRYPWASSPCATCARWWPRPMPTWRADRTHMTAKPFYLSPRPAPSMPPWP